jgi:hypothetical protein
MEACLRIKDPAYSEQPDNRTPKVWAGFEPPSPGRSDHRIGTSPTYAGSCGHTHFAGSAATLPASSFRRRQEAPGEFAHRAPSAVVRLAKLTTFAPDNVSGPSS